MKLAYVEWLDASYQEGPLCEDDFEPRVVLVSAGLLARRRLHRRQRHNGPLARGRGRLTSSRPHTAPCSPIAIKKQR